MTPLEALDKINTMFLAYAPRDIREDKELNEDLFECIKTALKRLENYEKNEDFSKDILAYAYLSEEEKIKKLKALTEILDLYGKWLGNEMSVFMFFTSLNEIRNKYELLKENKNEKN